jgi:putative hydrolase of the HAD superfamily
MGIKAIVFDIGNVLIDESGVEARDFIANKYGFSAKDFWEYAKRNLGRSYRGELAGEDFFGGLISEFGLSGVDAKDLVKMWIEGREKTSRVNEVVRETLDKLREKYLLGVLSNSTALNEKVSVRRACYGVFDFKILSFEVGCRKPEKEIYEILVDRLEEKGVKPGEAIFVDDRKEDLVPAEELGIRTILFEDSEQMIRDLRGMEVEV